MISQNWKSQGEGQFEYRTEEGGEVVAYMDLLQTDSGKVVVKHTEVDESLAGRGIGKQLLEAVAAYVRENNFKILPVCPFAKNLMYKYPEKYRDLM